LPDCLLPVRIVTMVSRKEDKVDFDKLERELVNAVEADQRYWRENDAKLRAVHQKVATYDEFRCSFDLTLMMLQPLKLIHILCSTVEPRYLGTFRPGQIFGERQEWRLNAGSVIIEHRS